MNVGLPTPSWKIPGYFGVEAGGGKGWAKKGAHQGCEAIQATFQS